MKTLLSVSLIFIGILTSSAQNIPNAGFENWTPYSTGEYPSWWSTSDSVAVANLGGTSVFKSTDAYEGSLCIHLKSVQITFFGLPITGPGIATSGIVSLSGLAFKFSGGSPDTGRSRFFTAYYKYAPTNSLDAAIIKVYLFKRNILPPFGRDTIAFASQEITGTHSSYEQVVLAMNYLDFSTQPDSSLIILQSSRGINDPTLGIASEFVVDSLGFSGFVGVNELKNAISAVNIYPTPANDKLTIDVELKNNISLGYEIYNIYGQLIKYASMKTTTEIVDVSNLSSGKYILKIGDSKMNSLYSTNFSITR